MRIWVLTHEGDQLRLQLGQTDRGLASAEELGGLLLALIERPAVLDTLPASTRAYLARKLFWGGAR